ncbi:MAG: O-antigen ligase family protein [Alphaproteobacteria bacterium]|uniref:O-antigen ligase family protein n=1 Tax=Candidatus Nitrobium versatile TaxID=2884831 RepID=A0A953J9Q5_9BACT|nr:O-antigen ligase family protein [Candidatus Nitrobium versatile]
MVWFVIGYLFLFVFRPFEYWPVLATIRIERVYMLFLMTAVFLWRHRKHKPHPVNSTLFAFFSAMLLSSLFAFRMQEAYWASFDYFKLIVFYYIIVLTLNDEEQMKKFIIAYLAVMFLYVGKSAWEFFVNDRHMWRMGLRRMIGIDTTYGDPNSFAASIAYSLPFLWAMLKQKSLSFMTRKMLWAYGILAGTCIVFTGSRSGMVTALLFLFLVLFGASRKVLGVTLVLVMLAFTWNYMPEEYQVRFKSIFVKGIAPKGADASAEGRIGGLKQGIHLFGKYPLLGIGPGNFKYGWETMPVGGSAHNLYGELLGELGGVGFLAFLFLVGVIIKTHRGITRETGLRLSGLPPDAPPGEKERLLFLRYVSVASVQALVLLLFNGNFGHNLYRYNWLWIGALGVLSAWFLQRKADRKSAVPLFAPGIRPGTPTGTPMKKAPGRKAL